LASVVKHPSDIEKGSLPNIIGNLSNHQFKFSYHTLSDNRGVLTNILNNALMEAHPSEFYTPLLYLPDGVVYLATADAPAITTGDIPEQVIAKIKSFCADKLKLKQTGFSRDGKGFKFADYYWLFFDTVQLMEVSIDAACRLIPSTKTSSAKKRSDSLVAFQKEGDLPESLNVQFTDDYRIDRLAEFGDILCRGIWNAWRDRFNNWQKQQPKANRKNPPDLDLTQKLAEHLVYQMKSSFKSNSISQKNRWCSLDWYYLAAKYLQRNLGLDEAQIREKMAEMVNYAASFIRPIIEEFTIPMVGMIYEVM
jgi:CRISPR-associated protein Csc3